MKRKSRGETFQEALRRKLRTRFNNKFSRQRFIERLLNKIWTITWLMMIDWEIALIGRKRFIILIYWAVVYIQYCKNYTSLAIYLCILQRHSQYEHAPPHAWWKLLRSSKDCCPRTTTTKFRHFRKISTIFQIPTQILTIMPRH